MVFWIAVLVGGLFAWYCVRAGFLSSWILFFCMLLAAYMAVFVTPVLVKSIPAATNVSFGCALMLLSTAVATFLVLYGFCYAAVSGRFKLVFPGMLDTVGSGVAGFLGGVLLMGVLAIAVSFTPWSQGGLLKSLGFDRLNTPTTTYVCWWCNRVHWFIGNPNPADGLASLALLPRPQLEEAPVMIATPAVVTPPPKIELPKVPVVKEQQPLPDPTEDGRLTVRRAFVRTPKEISAAITNPKIKIIEVANVCSGDKLDAAQTTRLKDWVFKGGILWATNDVLTLFGVPHSKPLQGDGELSSLVSGNVKVADILKDCKKVAVKDAADRVYVLGLGENVVPLLTLENDVSGDLKAGTADWSMIPYGKGWISDPKPVDDTRYDSKQFWFNFCQFCLREAPEAPAQKRPWILFGKVKGPLFGVWESPAGETVMLDDNQSYITVSLTHSTNLDKLKGTLQRVGGRSGGLAYRGTLDVVFLRDRVSYQLDSTLTAANLDSPDHIKLTFKNCPLWDNRGRKTFGTLWVDLMRAPGDVFGKPPPAPVSGAK